MRSASACVVSDHALKNSLLAPNVPAPKQSSGTFNPDLPSCLYSIALWTFRVSSATREQIIFVDVALENVHPIYNLYPAKLCGPSRFS
jgi:hypothetical protein